MDKTLSGYLDQVDRRLRPLPAGERADIILEIRSEILELEAAGAAPEEILSRLAQGELNVDAAVEALKQLKGGKKS